MRARVLILGLFFASAGASAGTSAGLPVMAQAAPMQAPSQNASDRNGGSVDMEKDPVLKAMLEELDRSKQHLQLPGFPKPFFIEYRIDDQVQYQASAEYGALTREHEGHGRIAVVRVRVGSYKTDSSTARGDGARQLAVLDDNPVALRYALWAATDDAYKAALRDYTQKQASLKSVAAPPQADDFSQEKPVVSLAPIAVLALDRAAWRQRIVDGSGLYRTDPQVKGFAGEIQASTGLIEAVVRSEYLVNSEGTVVRKSAQRYRAGVSAETQAADGMRLADSYFASGAAASDLGSVAEFDGGVRTMLANLNRLRNAPVIAEEYHGPVLFSGSASARTFYHLFSSAVTARRPELGSTARTVGPFASSYQGRVLPDFFQMTDDPLLTRFHGQGLIGAYAVDDEGVPARRVDLVDKGKLAGYLLGREPVRGFPQSNGHGRAPGAQAPRPAIGVLHIEAAGGISQEDLVKKLLAMGKDQGLDSVYLIQTLAGQTQPRLLYRIKVSNGSRELVRGAELSDVDLRSFRSGIVAAGQEPYVYNIFSDPPASVVAPSILLDDVTVKRAEGKNDRLPYYPPPGD